MATKKHNTNTSHITISLSGETREWYEKASKAAGVPLATFLRLALIEGQRNAVTMLKQITDNAEVLKCLTR
jgi:hypothetical protein